MTALQGGLGEAVQVLFGPKLAQKSDFFYATPIQPTFLVSVGPDSMQPYPEITLDTFIFP